MAASAAERSGRDWAKAEALSWLPSAKPSAPPVNARLLSCMETAPPRPRWSTAAEGESSSWALSLAGLSRMARNGDFRGARSGRAFEGVAARARHRLAGFGRDYRRPGAVLVGADVRGFVVRHPVDVDEFVVGAAVD